MVDDRTPEKRSENMARIKGADTGPEIALRKCLWSKGVRYRLKSKLLGKPDLVFTGKRLVVFVDGCFWHGCSIHGNIPKSNTRYWKAKIGKNIARDERVTNQLLEDGWRVLRFWEHEVFDDVEKAASKIINTMNDDK